MTAAPARSRETSSQPVAQESAADRPRVVVFAWLMAASIAIAVCGAALSFNGVLRGWSWYWPVATTVWVVAITLAALRSLRAQPVLVTAGALLALGAVTTLTFLRGSSVAGIVPTEAGVPELERLVRRASETVLSETAPVAPNAGIVMVVCVVLGLSVILLDALAVPLGMPAATGVGLLAIFVVPAMIKPESVGVWAFLAATAGFLMILACSQWFAPDAYSPAGPTRNPGQFRRAAMTGSAALAATLVISAVIPGFERGTFPQGSRLNPFSASTGLNPMITLGNNLRTPAGLGRITYATNSPTPLYLRSVTVDHFDGDAWGPDDRGASRRPLGGRIEPDHAVSAGEELTLVTAIDAGTFSSPYLPAPYAVESVRGLDGRWTWDPATLSIKGTESTTRRQEYLVLSSAPKISAALLARSSPDPRGIPEDFSRIPGNVPDNVRATASAVAGPAGTPYEKAMALQRYLRSPEFEYSLQAPAQGGYDGNGLSVLGNFLEQKSGYCIHYASAMAVMARLEGIPSRIAVGFAPGRMTGATVSVAGQGPLPEYEVDSRDAHAWPELYFQGLGWVPFEPTPSRGVVPDYATAAPAPALPQFPATDDLVPDPAPAPLPGTSPAPVPDAGGSADAAADFLPWLLGAGGFLGAALLMVAPRLSRTVIRTRRLKGSANGEPAVQVWDEIVDLGTDYGFPPLPSETPRAYSFRLCGSAGLGKPEGRDGGARGAVEELTGTVERLRYGPPPAEAGSPRQQSVHGGPVWGGSRQAAAARVAAVESAFRANATPLRRWRATWIPASVTGKLGRGLAAPCQAAAATTAMAVRAAARSLSARWSARWSARP